jgi:hypothetical protein
MKDLLIPYGLLDNDLGCRVLPINGVRSVQYRCPSCDGRVFSKAPPGSRRHFYHKKPSTGCSFVSGSAGESPEHESVKFAIKNAIDSWVTRGGPSPEIRYLCRACMSPTTPTELQLTPSTAVTELSWCKLRLDVAILATDDFLGTEDQVVFAIEVRHRHAVPFEKRQALSDLPWGEIRTKDFNLDVPHKWLFSDGGSPALPLCGSCQALRVTPTAEKLVVGWQGPDTPSPTLEWPLTPQQSEPRTSLYNSSIRRGPIEPIAPRQPEDQPTIERAARLDRMTEADQRRAYEGRNAIERAARLVAAAKDERPDWTTVKTRGRWLHVVKDVVDGCGLHESPFLIDCRSCPHALALNFTVDEPAPTLPPSAVFCGLHTRAVRGGLPPIQTYCFNERVAYFREVVAIHGNGGHGIASDPSRSSHPTSLFPDDVDW